MKKLQVIMSVLLLAMWVQAETNRTFSMDFPRWAPSMRGGSVYNFETDMDQGGAFSVNRYFIEGGITRMWSFDRMLSFSAGFGQDDYRFSDTAGRPWGNIDNFRASVFGRWGLNEKWALFAAPSVRSYGEAGTDLDDALTLAFFGGASYKFSDRLTLGPGLGVFERIEDDVRYYPIIIVNWAITDRLSLETGGGLAATAGPGLSLVYKVSKKWTTAVTTRYESKRFRLNEDGLAPNGVGEDESIPIVAQLTYFFYPQGLISGVIGYSFGGSLSADDQNGNFLYETKYDPSPSIGIVASFRL